MSMLLIEPIGNKPVRLIGKGLNATIVLTPGEPQEIDAALGAKLLKQCSQSIRICRSQWTQAWQELADLTSGIEQSDPSNPLINLLLQADRAFERDSWEEFQMVVSRIKNIIEEINPGSKKEILDGTLTKKAAMREVKYATPEKKQPASAPQIVKPITHSLFVMQDFYLIDDFKKLSPAQQQTVLNMNPKGTFNPQKNDSIEWARFSWNPITGCLHNCDYCLHGDTLILMADGRALPIRSLRVGDAIIGTCIEGRNRKLVTQRVQAHWKTVKEAYEVTLADGRVLTCSGNHRWLTNRGWKYTHHRETRQASDGKITHQCPNLTVNDRLLGFGPAVQARPPDRRAIKNNQDLQVRSVVQTTQACEMYDITTETGDFIANGVVSHNCYARDIAQDLYPTKFLPTLWPKKLAIPRLMTPPERAKTDVGYKNVFVCSMADLFGKWVPKAWIEKVLEECRQAPQWNFLFLTKFPSRLAEFEFAKNMWVGTTVDCQARVKEAEKAFKKVKAAVKWLSCEPLIEDLKFSSLEMFDWQVVGGASASKATAGTKATPEYVPPSEWLGNLYVQAAKAKVPVYEKTNGRPREYPGFEYATKPEDMRYIPEKKHLGESR